MRSKMRIQTRERRRCMAARARVRRGEEAAELWVSDYDETMRVEA